ncbi:MAG: beta-ketoacyl-[acyl-carrier-protein] synthase II [Candidatus Marinimicrobia bacterium]|nr:beta-ketoacyl-[acyl-carrier-protein] synthase II [Candidatus Neomarinimicrobiota bacterium]
MTNKVVITGLGIVSPIGNKLQSFTDSLKSGINGVGNISLFDTNDFNVNIAAESSIILEDFFDKKELNRLDRFTAFSLIASRQAVKQAELNNPKDDNNIGVIVGSGIGGINTFEVQHKRLLKHPKRVSPYFIPSMISDIAAGQISIEHGFKGPNYGIVSACATGSHAIGDAYKQIKYGDADIILCGGSEAPITPMSIAGFSNMKALTKNSNISKACRPFDLQRDGFVMGEGAGIIILENEHSAIKRNVKILGEVVGYGATADAYHITSPVPNGLGASRAMEIALKENNVKATQIDYINAHGTSTPFNDKNETKAIKNTFKNHSSILSISSTKSMTGHLLGAAGAVEAICCIQAINESFIPPTINFENADPECDLNYNFNKSINKKVKYAMSNTFGFGGHNASLIFKQYE